MTKEVLEKFLKLIHLPNGIILVTGPTGCGKTTTLYAAVSEINSPEDKIITTEDPVEYELPGIVQININPKVGLTFAACLRSILRQDPDIILVGEVRDLETAQTAVQASLTGHLVFSTLHTNSAAGTITRLVDMGVEPFLITSTMEAVVGQRLIRTICPNCRRPFEPTPDEMGEFGVTPQDVADIVFYKGSGCDECSFTGYKGRIGIFELLIITEEIKDLILRRASTDEIQAMALHLGMTSMRQDGWLKICLGLTTFDEVARQTPQESKEQIAEEMERVVKETIERVAASKIQRKPAPAPIKEPVSAPADQAPDAPSQPWSGEEAIQPYKVGDATETQE
jgi:type II secretory ATPase GspE/PulE/Tfp pilus assembly ATPase PilB-like protein